MPRFFVPSTGFDGDIVRITGDDARHIARALRMATGETVTVCDMHGTTHTCVLERITDAASVARIVASTPSDTEPPYPVTLYQAFPKGDKMDAVVQKAVESGACAVVPFLSERCVSRPDDKSVEKKIARWQRIALEAAKQCGRGIIPEVRRPLSYAQMLEEAAAFAGTVPVKNIVPIWKKGTRYLYTGGSVPMRDAAIYVRENSWDDAYELWRQAFEGTKNQKKKMRAALNIAVYYEMKDSLAKAEEWAEKAQQLAKKIDKKNITDSPQATIDDVPNYYLTTLYLAELKERNAQLPKLKLQMSRFNDDF